MKGSVTKYHVLGSTRPKWRYRIYTGKDDAGKHIYVGKGGFDKQGEADKSMRAHIDWLEQPKTAQLAPAPELSVVAGAECTTLLDWLTRWVDTFAVKQCSPKTAERYRTLLHYLALPEPSEIAVLAGTPIIQLKRAGLRAAFFAMLTIKGRRRERISVRTVRHVAGLVSVALSEAVEQELIPSNPMFKLKLPKIEKTETRSLDADEVRTLREACRGDWTFTLVDLALATGARRGELLALTWDDVDWIGRSITISKSLEQTKAGLRIKRPKNEKRRTCSLPQTAIVALEFQKGQQQEMQRSFAGTYRDKGLIFAQPDGSYLEPDLVSQTIVRRLRKAGIEKASFHTLRHTHASHLLSRGVPLPAVSARLGHADSNITARVYSHALPDDDRRGADTWDSIMNGKIQ